MKTNIRAATALDTGRTMGVRRMPGASCDGGIGRHAVPEKFKNEIDPAMRPSRYL